MKAKDLRNSILQMAVQGKLVPQDPNDEPASALLERIRAERAKLIKEKKIKAPKGGESVIYRASDGSHYEKRGKGEPVCIDNEIPFEIPESWEWVRLENVCRVITDGDHQPPPQVPEGVPFLVISNVSSGDISFEGTRFVPRSYYDELDDSRKPKTGDLLFTVTGSFGIPVIVRTNREFCFQRHIALLKPLLNVEYLWWVVQTPAFFNYCDLKATGTAQRTVSLSTLRSGIVPVPPESEQDRILEYLSGILPLVDQYGALDDARECLDAELPDRLRKSILQIAVQGKLVEQDPADEPASALLERIREERAKLIKEKKLKAPKGGESVIYRASDGGYYEKRSKGEPQPIEVPFGIPESWEWARIGSVFDMQAGKNIAAANISDIQDEKHPYPCFGGNGIRGYVQEPNRNGRYPIVGRQGALCGCVNYAEGELYATEHAVVTTCFDKTDVSWACIVLEALNLNQYATATAQPGLAVSKIVDVFIPVPPAGEQARIAEVYEAYKRFTNQ